MVKFYVTYSCGSNLRNCYSVVEGENYDECRKKVFAGTGGKHAFTYQEDDYADCIAKYCIAKYNLREVPLQPQEMLK